MNPQVKTELIEILSKPSFDTRLKALKYVESVEVVEEEKPKAKRTDNQNRALHLWLSQVAEELDCHGYTLQNVVEKIQKAEIRPNKDNLKECLWKPYQLAALNKDSTTKLTKHEVDKVYEGLNKFLGEQFEIHIPFPSDDNKPSTLQNIEEASKLNYPEMDENTLADKF